MQNSPLQFNPAPPVKNAVDTVNKVESAPPASNDSFQNMLSKQVQNKQAQSKPANAESANKKTKPEAGQTPATASTSQTAQNQGQQETDAAKDVKAKQAADALEAAKKKDGVQDAAATVIDPTLAGQSVLAMPVLDNKAADIKTDDADALANASNSAQRSLSALDNALNKALSQGKGEPADSTVKQESDIAQDLHGSKVNAENTRWLDTLMPNTKQGANLADSSELANSQLLSSMTRDLAAKDVAVKDGAIKDIAPTASYQPATVINAVQAGELPASSNVINVPLGKSGWDQAISQKVMWMVGTGEQSATLTLNPPDLGPLQVVIHVHNDQANTTFISDNADVRQALENGLSTLRDKMSESGIQLGQANINSGSQQAQQEFQQATQNRMARSAIDGTSQQDIVAKPQAIARVANGLVDTFA